MQSRRPYLPPATPLTPTSERSDQTDLQDDLTERNFCPTCLRPIHSPTTEQESTHTAPNYFRLLAEAASVPGSRDGTRPGTPTTNSRSSTGRSRTEAQAETGNIDQKLQEGVEVDGYYARFFIEERKLGRGARGTVYLCQHVLNGNRLGRYAIKKIPVGVSFFAPSLSAPFFLVVATTNFADRLAQDHNESLLRSLQEVHLMESLQHPNIVHYQHACECNRTFNHPDDLRESAGLH